MALFYRGPDIPCFLNILKWVMTSTNDTNGSRKVCILYNRDSLPDLTLNPPLNTRTNADPIPGNIESKASGTIITILQAQ